MRILIILLLSSVSLTGQGIMLAGGAVAEEPGIIPTDYLSFHKFDGNGLDVTGNYNLANSGMSYTTDQAGNANAAAYFDGVSSFYALDNESWNLSSANGFTFSFWIYSEDPVQTESELLLDMFRYNGSQATLRIQFLDDRTFRLTGYNGANIIYVASSAGFINYNQWYHFAITYDPLNTHTWTVKVDNTTALTNQIQIGYFNFASSSAVTVGVYQLDTGRFEYKGALNNLRLYHRVLTDTEISAIYNYELNNQ